jgi:hypothetical protein
MGILNHAITIGDVIVVLLSIVIILLLAGFALEIRERRWRASQARHHENIRNPVYGVKRDTRG